MSTVICCPRCRVAVYIHTVYALGQVTWPPIVWSRAYVLLHVYQGKTLA